MNKQFATRILTELEAKNRDNPDFGAFIADFNSRGGNEQKAILADIAKKMGMSFEADVDQTKAEITPLTSFVQGAAKSATFGQGQRAAAAIGAAMTTQEGAPGYQETLKKYEAREAQAAAENPVSYALGRGLGYLANPLAAGVKIGAGITGLMATAGTQTAIVEGGINTLEAGKKFANGEIDTKQFIAEAAGKTAQEATTAALGAGILGAASKGLFSAGKYALGKVNKSIYQGLSRDAQIVVDSLDEAVKIPDKKAAAAQLENAGKQVIQYYENLRAKVTAGLSDDIAKAAGDDVLDFTQSLDDIINKQATEATQIVAGMKPKNITENLADTQKLLRFAYENISTNYGKLMDEAVASIPKGKAQADFSDALSILKDAISDGSAQALAPKESQLLSETLKKLGSGKLKSLSFKTADQLRDVIDDVIPYGQGKLTGMYEKLYQARDIISQKLKNPEVFGRAAEIYSDIQNTYGATLRSKKALLGVADIAGEALNDPANFVSTLKRLQNGLAKVAEPMKKLQGARLIEFSPEHQKLYGAAIENIKQTIKLSDMSKFARAKSTLRQLINAPDAVDNEVASKFKEIYQGLYGDDIFARLKTYETLSPKISKALKNPLNANLRADALKFVEEVMPQNIGKVKSVLDRAAHASRVGTNKVYTEVAPFVDDILKNKIATPEELKTTVALADVSPDLEEAFTKMIAAHTKLKKSDFSGFGLPTSLFGLAKEIMQAGARNPAAIEANLKLLDLPQSKARRVLRDVIKFAALQGGINQGAPNERQ